MVVIDAANARTEPSTMGTVVSTLPRGLKLTTVEERGTLGEADGSDAKPAAATRKLR
jgi:hypothetical protein